MNMNKEELIGSVYGEWTILSYNEEVSKEKHRTYYNCKCSCGTNIGKKQLSVRAWTCPHCGVTHDRDINASINILQEGKRQMGMQ